LEGKEGKTVVISETIKGCRLYLKADFIELSRNHIYLEERTEGDDVIWERSFNVARKYEEEAKKIFKDSYLVRFNIIEARPLVDMEHGILKKGGCLTNKCHRGWKKRRQLWFIKGVTRSYC
jgi:hypothetical protein